MFNMSSLAKHKLWFVVVFPGQRKIFIKIGWKTYITTNKTTNRVKSVYRIKNSTQ